MFLKQTTITFVDKHTVSFMSSKNSSPEEILKKMLDGYYSKLPRHIIKDIINSYQEKNIQ